MSTHMEQVGRQEGRLRWAGGGGQGHLGRLGILTLKRKPPGQRASKNFLGEGGIEVEKDLKPLLL